VAADRLARALETTVAGMVAELERSLVAPRALLRPALAAVFIK